MTRRLPRTSYGYLPPPGARASGWRCPGADCGRVDQPAPRRWPYRCPEPECGTPVDPVLEPPWFHPAEGRRLRYVLAGGADDYMRALAEADYGVWCYQDACLRDDRAAAADARLEFRQAMRRAHQRGWGAVIAYGLSPMVRELVGHGDLGAAGEEILAWHPVVETDDLEEDSDKRYLARVFLLCCIAFLECRDSIRHPLESAVYDAMTDIRGPAEGVLTSVHLDGFKRIEHVRREDAERVRLDEEKRLLMATGGTSPGLPDLVRRGSIRRLFPGDGGSPLRKRIRHAESTVASARSGGAPEQLRDAIGDLGEILRDPGLSRASCVRAAVALADAALLVDERHDDPAVLAAAADDLDRGDVTSRGGAPVRSLAHLLRARVSLTALHDAPAEAASHFEAAKTELLKAAAAADRELPRLLAEIRATLARLIAYQNPSALDEAIDECRAGRRRTVRPWRQVTAADTTLARLLVWRALQARSEPGRPAGGISEAIRLSRRPWRSGGTLARLTLNEARCARDALSGAVGAVGAADRKGRAKGWRQAVARSAQAPTADRIRLAAAWVAWAVETDDDAIAAEAYHHLMSLIPLHAATRYRPAAKDRVLAASQEHTEEAGYWLTRARRYRDAVMALETGRAVKLSELAVRDRSGTDPAALDVDYGDVTAATADGPVVYVAAAKGGGYALVVAADHDPQYVELPHFRRSRIEGLLEVFQPDDSPAGVQRMASGLKWLWDNGMQELMPGRVHGRIVTLIPVGLLGLIPLHAACDPAARGDPDERWSHVSQFSAIRYAPNARALCRSRETARQLTGMPIPLLAADVPEGYGCDGSRLRHAAAEAGEVARIWRGARTELRHRCTWEDFRDAALSCSVWHLACHGKANPAAILESRLHFADAAVTLDQVSAELSSSRRRLAVLSACETHLTGTANPNEAIGLPSALLQLGFAGVIAAAWPIREAPTAYLMARFYRLWHDEGMDPPVALRAAQQWLRRATRAELAELFPGLIPAMGRAGENQEWRPFCSLEYWAAFTYTGA